MSSPCFQSDWFTSSCMTGAKLGVWKSSLAATSVGGRVMSGVAVVLLVPLTRFDRLYADAVKVGIWPVTFWPFTL